MGMVDSCQDEQCVNDIFVNIEMDGGIIDGHGAPYGLSLRQRKDFVIVVTGYKKIRDVNDIDNIGNVTDGSVSSSSSINNSSFPCAADEYQCSKSQFDDRHYMSTEAAPRCIWSKLRCDYHQIAELDTKVTKQDVDISVKLVAFMKDYLRGQCP